MYAGRIILLIMLSSMGCQTVKKKTASASSGKSASLVSKDIAQNVKWQWSWNGKTSTLNEPYLFHILYANASYLGLRADSPISAATNCVAGTDCSAECNFEVFRPASIDGDVLTDRVLMNCTLSNPRAPKGMNQIYLAGYIDSLAVSYRPKADGEKSVSIKGPFATELYASFQLALRNNRYLARAGTPTPQNPKPVVYQYLVPKSNWYFLFKLDAQSAVPNDSNLSLLCSSPPSDNEESTCVFRL